MLLPATIGGLLGKMANKANRITFKTKLLNRNLEPTTTVMAGVMAAIVLGALLEIIIYSIYPPILDNHNMELISALTLYILASLIGGFIATYFVKEKKMQYGLYEGIGLTIFTLLYNIYLISRGYANPNIYNPYILISTTLGYILAATIGGYLGKRTDTNLKQTTKAGL